MSESNVPFTDADSSSRKFRTSQRTSGANTVEEYQSVVSEPIQPTYAVSFASTVISTNLSHTFQLMAGASNRVYLRKVTVFQATNAAANTPVAWELRRLSTAGTGGSSITPAPMDPASSVSGATVMVLPSSKGTEGVSLGRFRSTLLANASTANLQPLLDLDWTRERTKGPIIGAGTSNGLALKNVTTDASAQVEVYFEFGEDAVA